MPAIDQIVKINVTNLAQAVTQQSFAVPLIVGPTAASTWGSDVVRTYTSAAALLADGFTTASPEYIYAGKLLSQSISPSLFLVGKRSMASAGQTDTFVVNTLLVGQYTLAVNGISVGYQATSSDTQLTLLTAIGNQIQAQISATYTITGTGTSTLLTVVAASGLTPSYTSIDNKFTHTVTPGGGQVSAGIAADLAAITAVNNNWYGLVIASATDADILAAAAYIETLKKIYIAVSATAAIATTATTDVGSQLKAASYKRTALMYSVLGAAQGIEAAWMGGQLPQTPGANNWAFKNLSGITADVLMDSQQAILIGSPVSSIAGKNVNIYQSVGGINMTQMGVMAGGQYIDLTIGIDYLQSRMQTNVFSALVNAAKIPYTNDGVALLLAAVRSTIDIAVVNNLVDGKSPITVTAPLVSTVSQNDRSNRVSPQITFTCRFSGAINAVTVNGTVNV